MSKDSIDQQNNQRNERKHPITESEDQRTESQRDRDRILYTRAFRRLSDVTQVFAAAQTDIFHNRLTHTIQVSQIAKRIAEYILRKNDKKYVKKLGGLDPDVVETAALIHDLGHPPFGHLGEQTLNSLAITNGLRDGYEGNAQSFRIVNIIENRYDSGPGLNLTRATLNASLKYPWTKAHQEDEYKSKKYGVYDSEKEIFEWVREYTSFDSPNLEAQIMDFADDIAYSIHDFEDFFRAGLIPVVELSNIRESREPFKEYFFNENKHKNYKESEVEKNLNYIFETLFIYCPVKYTGKPDQLAKLKQFSSRLISSNVRESLSLQDENGVNSKLKIFPNSKMIIDILKYLTRYYVIDHHNLATEQEGYKRIIEKIFYTFFYSIYPEKKARFSQKKNQDKPNLRIFPEPYRTLIQDKSSTEEKNVRYIIDMIASMTENQITSLYKNIMGLGQKHESTVPF